MSSTEHIEGWEKLVAALGDWPTFHDAEVISVSAERSIPVEVGCASARVVVHIRRYETRGEGTAQYEQVLSRNVLATFQFSGVADLELSEFNHQNVINSLVVHRDTSQDEERAPYVVTIESICGLGGTLRGARVELAAVEVLPSAVA